MRTLMLLTLGILAIGYVGHAHFRPSPGEFSLEGEWLYLRPSVDDPFFALSGSSTFSSEQTPVVKNLTENDIKIQTNEFPFHSGYRVSGAYGFCCCGVDVRAQWTQTWSSTSDRSEGHTTPIGFSVLFDTNIFDNIEGPGVVESNNSFRFERFELLLGKCLFSDPCYFDFLFLAGLQYARAETNKKSFGLNQLIVQVENESLLATLFSESKERRSFWGVGPQVGFDFAFNLGCGVNLIGNIEGAILLSRMNSRVKASESCIDFSSMQQPIITTIKDAICIERNWRLVPSYDARFGFDYSCDFDCFSLGVAVGYQMLSYFRAIPLQSSITPEIQGYSNIDMHGPFANFNITF